MWRVYGYREGVYNGQNRGGRCTLDRDNAGKGVYLPYVLAESRQKAYQKALKRFKGQRIASEASGSRQRRTRGKGRRKRAYRKPCRNGRIRVNLKQNDDKNRSRLAYVVAAQHVRQMFLVPIIYILGT